MLVQKWNMLCSVSVLNILMSYFEKIIQKGEKGENAVLFMGQVMSIIENRRVCKLLN